MACKLVGILGLLDGVVGAELKAALTAELACELTELFELIIAGGLLLVGVLASPPPLPPHADKINVALMKPNEVSKRR